MSDSGSGFLPCGGYILFVQILQQVSEYSFYRELILVSSPRVLKMALELEDILLSADKMSAFKFDG